MRIAADGTVLQQVKVEIPHAIFLLLQHEKVRTGLSANVLLGRLISGHLQQSQPATAK